MPIVERELVLLRAEALVVVDQGLNLVIKLFSLQNRLQCKTEDRKKTMTHLLVGQLRMAIVDLILRRFIKN